MTDLITRLEQAEAGSRELDYLIEQEVGDWINKGGGWRVHKITGERQRHFGQSSPVTTSLDAITALIGEKLPGRFWQAGSSTSGWARIIQPEQREWYAEATSTPLALCIALLRAIKEGADG